MQILKIKNLFKFFLILFALISAIAGIKNLIKFGGDCHIKGAKLLLYRQSPYFEYLENRDISKTIPPPTILPQGLYILLPFALLNNFCGYLLYGIIGVIGLYFCKFLKKNNKDFENLYFLLLLTLPYRNNIGLGQSLFFYFPMFILFDHLMKNKNTPFFNYFANPFLLMILFSKPNLAIWIPLYYPFNKRTIKIYSLALCFQVIVIYIFTIHSRSTITLFLNNYLTIAKMHLPLAKTTLSAFAINFSSILFSISSILVIFNFFMILIVFYYKFFRKYIIPDYYWMFSVICFSFILFYHHKMDIFLLLLPLFTLNENVFKSEYIIFLIFIIFLIIEKLIFIMDKFVPNIPLIVNFLSQLLIFYIFYQFFKKYIFLKIR